MPSVSSLDEAVGGARCRARGGAPGADRRRPHGGWAEPDPRARSGRPDVHGRGGRSALRASRGSRCERTATLPRPTGRPDDRGAPRAEPLRPAAPSLRRAARPRARRHARARGRNDRERRWEGREERRRLRPRAPRVRLRGPPRLHRASKLQAPPAAEGDRNARRRDGRRGRCRGAAPPLAAAAERARRPPPRPRRGPVRGIGASGRAHRSRPRRRWSAARRPTQPSGRSRGSVRRQRAGVLRFAPGRPRDHARSAGRSRRPAGVRRRVRSRAHGRRAVTRRVDRQRLVDAIRAQLDPQGVLAA